MKIGLDIMGGDFAPKNCLDGAVLALKELPKDVKIVLIGDKDAALKYFEENKIDGSAFEYIHTKEVIEMGEHPTKAFSQKPQSSIAIGFKLLKDQQIDAFGSAGNTGAMLVGSMFSVKAIPGVIRPCITTILPKLNGGCGIMLDVGTNADCKPDVLYQFGILGSIYAKEIYKIDNPKVGLLNIGEEPEKGNLVAQSAYNLMKETKDFNFIGNVEGRDLFGDKVDVIVCDGFVGNIMLKMAESFYRVAMKRKLNDEYFDRFNYELYGGTPILGINSTVMISHGISSPVAFKNMIVLSKDVVEARLNEKINTQFN
ncbi:MAG: phosphate acyltransferase PlsX [Bacteroidia bacterium]|jgi:phosphate acyltransferase|nr:phosphate acyltransferase PlsX [Sphingobacteriaceae bacterium]MBK7310685.1 phosphate acyltransferase PlsX [Sphingobacteriaceae bacterium]MBP9068660.1 phosphate acyltransferase PlsX [Bacteroidia bacterium]